MIVMKHIIVYGNRGGSLIERELTIRNNDKGEGKTLFPRKIYKQSKKVRCQFRL